MDLSLLPASEYNKQRSGACFTVRSANSPSYSLTRRQGVRKTRGFFDKGRESTEEVGERECYGTTSGPNVTNKQEDYALAEYQPRSWSRSSVKGEYEINKTPDHEISPKLNQNGSADKTIAEFGMDRIRNSNPASESRGRTEWRRHNLPNRSKSLDWRAREKSPEQGKWADAFMLSTKRGGNTSQQAESFDEKRTWIEGVRGRVMSSVQAYNSAGTNSDGQERNKMSCISQTLERASWGNSLPSRLRSQSGPGSDFRETATMLSPKGGQSILERIEKLYGSSGFGKTKDCSKIWDFSKPLSPQQKSYERTAGGTFPRRFSSGDKSSLSPVQSRKSFTGIQIDTTGSETSLSVGTRRTGDRLSWGQWPGQTQGNFSKERGGHWSKALEDIGTKSLDRARSRYTVAAQIRSARSAGGIPAPPQPNTFIEEDRLASWRGLSWVSERGGSVSKDQGEVTHGGENVDTDQINKTLKDRSDGVKEQEKQKRTYDRAKEETELKASITDDVFELNPQKITIKTMERKKSPEMLSYPLTASVKNKINQFEALTQRSQGLATGQVLPRRAFSVPTQLSRVHGGRKESRSVKAKGELRGMQEGLKEGKEAGENAEMKGTLSGRTLVSGRSSSVDEVGLRLERKEREGSVLIQIEETEKNSVNKSSLDFYKYSRLKNSLEIPLNRGDQRQHRNFYIDETDFSKVSSPEETSNRLPITPLFKSSDLSIGVQNTTPSPVGDEDKTPTNTPVHSPCLSPSASVNITMISDTENKSTSVLTQSAKTPKQHSPPLHCSLALPNLTTNDADTPTPNGKKQSVLDLNAWVAGLNTKIKVWNDEDDSENDDDESTQKDEDSNYDSDSGESSLTITSNMSQSDNRSFCVSLSDLCNFAGVDYESENDSDEWQYSGRRSASLSSDMSALSCVSVLPSEELDRLLEDVRSLGDSNLQDYNDVQVVVLHKEVGVGLGFSVAGGVDQNKPIIVHKVLHSGVAAQEGSIREGDQVLSINGTSLCNCLHWEALRVLRRAKTRNLGVVVLRRGGISSACKGEKEADNPGPTLNQFTETGQRVCVHLEKNGRDLGFSLEGGVGSSLENRPLTVQKIFLGGPDDKVYPGDEVLEIEGVSVMGMRRLEAWTLIRSLPPGPVDVVLRRPLKHLEIKRRQKAVVRDQDRERAALMTVMERLHSTTSAPGQTDSSSSTLSEYEDGFQFEMRRRIPAMLKLRALRVRNALARECMAEFLGTFVLLLFGCSAAAQVKTSRETKGQFLSVNMAFSVGVMSAMYLTKGITGAHLNPAVTLSFCMLGKVPWERLVPYCLSQLLGAYMASGLVYLVYYDAIMNFSGGVLTVYGPNETASIFATYPSEYLTLGRSFLDQVVGTGMLMLCILCLDEKRNSPAPSELIPAIVAVIVLGISMSMSGNCGAAINPARDLGPRLFTLAAGWGTEVFMCYNYWFWVPIVAPLIGAVTGTFMYLIFIHWHLPDPDQPEILSTF